MNAIERKEPGFDISLWLLLFAVCVDLLTPYLIWKSYIPAAVRWLSHIAVAVMIVVAFLRMLGLNRIPRITWLVVIVAGLWSYVAIGNGQGLLPTLWGAWLLFQFPLVALFMYLQPGISPRFGQYVRRFCLLALGIQVIAQLLQFASGVAPGDSLSGLFGRNGTGNAVAFALLVCCVFFGEWIATRKWMGLLIALPLGVVSSVLGEMKLFPVAITAIAVAAGCLYAIRYHTATRVILYWILIAAVVFGFVSLYNGLVPGAARTPLQTFLTDPFRLSTYMNTTNRYTRGSVTMSDIGRMDALTIGWTSLQRDPVTMLFGYGLGTRSESRTMGTAGIALKGGQLGLSVGTSLLVMMQEMGVIGMALLAFLFLWIILRLYHDVRLDPQSPVSGLRYALILWSVLWPVWLWYATTWTQRVPMLLYWMLLGYVLAASVQPRTAQALPPRKENA